MERRTGCIPSCGAVSKLRSSHVIIENCGELNSRRLHVRFPLVLSVSSSTLMARHQKDLYLCRNQPGENFGYLCGHCDGRCPICDSHANQELLVKICDECSFRQGERRGRCLICGSGGSNPAYYCRECVLLERDRDGCPKVKNLSNQRKDAHHESKKYAGT